MNKLLKLLGLSFTLILTLESALADVFLMGSRIGAEDPQATADFYSAAFNLKEVNRVQMGDGQSEIMLNFGESAEQAMASANAQIVIMPRESDTVAEAIPHLIFQVTNIHEVVASVEAAGGILVNGPVEFGDSGIFIVFATDPAGNQFELIQFPE